MADLQCWSANGAMSTDGPCLPEEEVSFCCGPGFVCLSTGYCMLPPDSTVQYRGTCTDPTWQSDACPKFCPVSEPGVLFQCPNDPDTWCCDGGRNCNCNGDVTLVHLSSYSILTVIGTTSTTGFVLTTYLPTTLNYPATSNSPATNSTHTVSSESAATVTITAITTRSSAAQTLTATSSAFTEDVQNQTTSNTQPTSNTAAIAVGATVPCVVVALLIGTIFFIRRQKRSRSLNVGQHWSGGKEGRYEMDTRPGLAID